MCHHLRHRHRHDDAVQRGGRVGMRRGRVGSWAVIVNFPADPADTAEGTARAENSRRREDAPDNGARLRDEEIRVGVPGRGEEFDALGISTAVCQVKICHSRDRLPARVRFICLVGDTELDRVGRSTSVIADVCTECAAAALASCVASSELIERVGVHQDARPCYGEDDLVHICAYIGARVGTARL